MVQLLINDVHYPTIRQETIMIDRTANDPIPTFKFGLQDDPSHIPLSEFLEVVFIDESQIANPTHNLLLNPALNPYTTHWTAAPITGITFAQNGGGGLSLTASNSNVPTAVALYQYSPNLVQPGQAYMFSMTIVGSAIVNLKAAVQIQFVDINGNLIGSAIQSTQIVPTGTPTVLPVQAVAPPNAVSADCMLVIITTNSTNSGTITYTQAQLEPMCFTTGNYQLNYPTPWCASGQPSCTLMPDSTTIRQYRLFGGYITKATAGAYAGNNRIWTVQVSGYGWLLQKQQLNNTWTNTYDSTIIATIVSQYFPGVFSTAQVAQGALLDTFGYAYNGYARDAFDALAANANFMYYVDAYRVIWYQPPGYSSVGFALSDEPDNVTSFSYYAYTLDTDGTQIGNVTLVTGATGIAAIEYDAASIAAYNHKLNGQGTFWRVVNDSTITTITAAQQRAIAENTQYNYGRKTARLSTSQLMTPGLTVLFTSHTDGLINAAFLIQKSSLVLKGFKTLLQPQYECVCDLGAFNPDLVNITVKMLRQQVKTTNSVSNPTLGLMLTDSMTFVESFLITTVLSNPSRYGQGTYGTSTYAASVPSIPTTQYGATNATYGNPAVGYN